MADFKKLEVWRVSHALYLNVDRVAGRFTGSHNASFRSQIVRAAHSIPTNIVEGRAMKGSREFARFLGYSIASAAELEYHFISARDRHLISRSEYESLIAQLTQVRKMLYALVKRLNDDENRADGRKP